MTQQQPPAVALGETLRKQPYSRPVLTMFGHVAALTQSTGCSANSDGTNAVCQVGATGMGPMSSDRRLKQDVVRLGNHPAGFGLYLFSYKPEHRQTHGHGRFLGVMADEVASLFPEAVFIAADGFARVDYKRLNRRAIH